MSVAHHQAGFPHLLLDTPPPQPYLRLRIVSEVSQMSTLSEAQILEALRPVQDPELKQSLVALGMIQNIQIEGGKVALRVDLTTPACPLKSVIQEEVEAALKAVPGVDQVEVSFGAQVRRTAGMNTQGNAGAMLEGVKNVVLVASGKGGVGKSTVAVNLAAALRRDGATVGLLDADIYGPSIPIMMGISRKPSSPDGKRILPLVAHGIRLMSIGFFVSAEQAMVWRGPILNQTIVQFLRDVDWGELDYLIVDLPPGTGDVQLSISQQLQVSGAVLVTTPQDVALADVIRGKAMFDQVKIPTLGVIENMSYFVGDDGKRYEIFGHGGGARAAERLGVSYLGEIPLVTAVRAAGDGGTPIVVEQPDSAVSQQFMGVARTLAGKISTHHLGGENMKKRKIFTRIFS